MGSVLIGYDMCHYAKLLTDDANTKKYAYETPIRVVGAIQASINPNVSNDTLYADDGPYETATTLGQIELQLSAADFPLEVQADMLGYDYAAGMIQRKSSAVPPYIAVGGRALKSNGKYRYFWLVKGKMLDSEQAHTTKGESIEWQTPTMTGSFVKRDSDNIWQVQADEDDPGIDPDVIKNWFKKVIGPEDVPQGVTINPPNGATGVSKDVTITLRFTQDVTDNASAIQAGTTLTYDNAGTPETVACTVTKQTDRMFTVKPNATLTANKEHTLELTVPVVATSKFTTET